MLFQRRPLRRREGVVEQLAELFLGRAREQWSVLLRDFGTAPDPMAISDMLSLVVLAPVLLLSPVVDSSREARATPHRPQVKETEASGKPYLDRSKKCKKLPDRPARGW